MSLEIGGGVPEPEGAPLVGGVVGDCAAVKAAQRARRRTLDDTIVNWSLVKMEEQWV
jgi:hypothetical protein